MDLTHLDENNRPIVIQTRVNIHEAKHSKHYEIFFKNKKIIEIKIQMDLCLRYIFQKVLKNG